MTSKLQKKIKRAQAAAAAAAAATTSSSSRPASPRGGKNNKKPSGAAKKKSTTRARSPAPLLTGEQLRHLALNAPRQDGQILGARNAMKAIAGVAHKEEDTYTSAGVDHVDVNTTTADPVPAPASATGAPAAGPAVSSSPPLVEADLVVGNITDVTAGGDDTLTANSIIVEVNPAPTSAPSTTSAPDASPACAPSSLITEEDAAVKDREVDAATGATAGGEIITDDGAEEEEEEETTTTMTRAASVSVTDRLVDAAEAGTPVIEAVADTPKVALIAAACPSPSPEAPKTTSTSFFSKIVGAVTGFFGSIVAGVRETVAVAQFCWYFSGFWA